MTGTKERSFLFGTDASACAGPGKRFGFYLWNFGILLPVGSRAVLSVAASPGSEPADVCCLSIIFGIH